MKPTKHIKLNRLGSWFVILYTTMVIGFYIYAETCNDLFCGILFLFDFIPWVYVFGIGMELLGVFVSDFWLFVLSFTFNCLTFYWIGSKINSFFKKN